MELIDSNYNFEAVAARKAHAGWSDTIQDDNFVAKVKKNCGQGPQEVHQGPGQAAREGGVVLDQEADWKQAFGVHSRTLHPATPQESPRSGFWTPSGTSTFLLCGPPNTQTSIR